MKTAEIAIAVVLLSFAAAAYVYPQMPEKIASHWNALGEADGYMPKSSGLFLIPVISVALLLLFAVIPKIDPLKGNIEKFRKYYERLALLIVGFMFYVQLLTIAWNSGLAFNMTLAMVPVLGLLFFYLGIIMENAKRNWFVGIRTPWTLSRERVWNKTHKIGGKLFKATGIIAVFGLLFAEYAIYFILVPAFATAVYTVIYSYLEYQKEKR